MLLAPTLLGHLRQHVRRTQSARWLFTNRNGSGPLSVITTQHAYQGARHSAHIMKPGGIHTLRHCFATYLPEGGVDQFTIQKLLGHGYIGTTSRYLHLTSPQLAAPKA